MAQKQGGLWQSVLKPVVLIIAILIGFQARGQEISNSTDQAAERIRPVKLITPENANGAIERRFFGQVTARETVDLSFEVAGSMTVFPVREGQVVPKEFVLAQLDLAPFERAVERAELNLARAERDLSRATQLANSNVASRTQAEDAQTERDLADVALREAREALQDATLRAPFDGLVAQRLTPTFSSVSPGQAIVRLHDVSQMRVTIDLPERLLETIGALSEVEVFAELPGQDEPVPVTLVEFQAVSSEIGQSYEVSFAIPDSATAGLIPGKSATVIGRLPSKTDGFEVPTSAIVGGNDRDPYVMLYTPGEDGAGTVTATPVSLSSPAGNAFVIDGISPGSQIVAAGAHLLRDGQRVRPYNGLSFQE
ncbi:MULTISPECIES: efflux RND transporter periplasmic adaptor subunit [Rhodobacterales]|uniref:Efflux RND transporter periplasmic adaptor subunit n=1 Tax=Parasulfitobacter algicola TaxID=2614809 RepID=A0ABX2IT76_9RHOB|nr:MULTISPECIES: efflux RND transporter periplasmic adaptor subunit [Rhodobacterales]NSX56104.1 efflux RND transporter periplasmic adaptor subunit [Sulfitobacter algicola]